VRVLRRTASRAAPSSGPRASRAVSRSAEALLPLRSLLARSFARLGPLLRRCNASQPRTCAAKARRKLRCRAHVRASPQEMARLPCGDLPSLFFLPPRAMLRALCNPLHIRAREVGDFTPRGVAWWQEGTISCSGGVRWVGLSKVGPCSSCNWPENAPPQVTQTRL